MFRMSLRIAIVGGSISGCTSAIEALRSGFQPTVFERSDEALRERGAGLGLPTGTAMALAERGYLTNEFPHVSIRHLAHSSSSGHAGRVPTFLEAVRWGHLSEKLRAMVPDDCYRQGVSVVAATEENKDEAELQFGDGTTACFDLVVFADGYRSLGRELVSPATPPNYLGYFLWRGVLPEHAMGTADFEATLQRVGFPGGHFFAYFLPSAEGEVAAGTRDLNWGMFIQCPPDRLADWLIDRFGASQTLSLPPGAMRETLQTTLKRDAESLLPADLLPVLNGSNDTFGQGIVSAFPDRYHRGRLCLVGDAGAVIPPFTTSGVFKGMRNAAELMSALAGNQDIAAALHSWDLQQQAMGARLKTLSQLMQQQLLDDVPDFGTFTQNDLERWWQPVQAALEHAMG